MRKRFFVLPFIAAVAIAIVVGKKTFGPESKDLLMQNVEALSEGDSPNYSGYAKDYETGEGFYITWVSGELTGSFKVGVKISPSALAELGGKVRAEVKSEWMMTCQKGMGCFTTCTDIDWRMGKREAGLVRGC